MNNWYSIFAFMIGVIFDQIAITYEVQINNSYKCLIIIFSIFAELFIFIPSKNWYIDTITSLSIAIGFILLASLFNCSQFKVLQFIGKNFFVLYLIEGKTI